MQAEHGTLTVHTSSGLHWLDGTTDAASGDHSGSTLSARGSLSSLNDMLASLSYVGELDWSGQDTISFVVTDQGTRYSTSSYRCYSFQRDSNVSLSASPPLHPHPPTHPPSLLFSSLPFFALATDGALTLTLTLTLTLAPNPNPYALATDGASADASIPIVLTPQNDAPVITLPTHPSITPTALAAGGVYPGSVEDTDFVLNGFDFEDVDVGADALVSRRFDRLT